MLPKFQDGSQDETLDNSDLNLSESRDTGQHSGGQSGGDPLDGLDGEWWNSVSLSLPDQMVVSLTVQPSMFVMPSSQCCTDSVVVPVLTVALLTDNACGCCACVVVSPI